MIMEKFFYDIQVAGIILVSSSVVKIIIKLITLKGMLANADQFGGKGDNIRSTLNFIAKRTRVVRGKDIYHQAPRSLFAVKSCCSETGQRLQTISLFVAMPLLSLPCFLLPQETFLS